MKFRSCKCSSFPDIWEQLSLQKQGELDLFLQASCKKKLHLPLLKSAIFKAGLGVGGGGGSAEMELNS